MKSGSVRIREIHVGIRRNLSSFRAPKRGFFSFSTHYLPSVDFSPIQLRLIAHIWISVVIFGNWEPLLAVKIEFTSSFAELRTFFWILRVPGNGPPSEMTISLPVRFLALVLRRYRRGGALASLGSSTEKISHRRRMIRKSGVPFSERPEIHTGMRSSIQSGLKRYISEPVLC